MKMQIYDSILHGAMAKEMAKEREDFYSFACYLEEDPTDLKETEELIQTLLGKRRVIDFREELDMPIGNVKYKREYTPRTQVKYEPDVEALIEGDETFVRYYKALFRLENRRIKMLLDKYASLVKDDMITRAEVMGILQRIVAFVKDDVYILKLSLHPDLQIDERSSKEEKLQCEKTYLTLQMLMVYLVKLYYEIVLMFDVINGSYILPQDMLEIMEGYFPKKLDLSHSFRVAMDIHFAQKEHIGFDGKRNEWIQQMLVQIYDTLEEEPYNEVLKEVSISLENDLWHSISGGPIRCEKGRNTMCFIAEYQRMKSVIMEKVNEVRMVENKLMVLENEKDLLLFFQDHPAKLKSIPRMLMEWIDAQIELYKSRFVGIANSKDASVVEKTKPTKRVLKRDVRFDLMMARDRLSYLSGYNLNKEKIMPEEDYKRMMEYVTYLIETGKVPYNVDKLPKIKLSNSMLMHTFYLLHKELYTMRPTRVEWIDFLQTVFAQLSNSSLISIRKKWQIVPKCYEEDLREMRKGR